MKSVAHEHRNTAVLYAPKSTEDTHGSIPTQLVDGRAMAAREGWEVVGEYADEAASAWSGDRGPQLTAAMEHAERQAPAILVVQHSDRLARGDGRSARHLGEIYFWALKAEVELRSVQDDSTFTNPLLTFAMGERNSEDSRRKSLAVKSGMARRAARGFHTGGRRPYGYRHAEDRSGLAIIPHEAEIVRRIFAEFVAGRSLSAIARDLYREGIATVRGGLWRQSTVGGILANPIYIGGIRHLGEVHTGVHQPIVDETLWQRVQDLLAGRSRKGRGRPAKGRHLFRGGMLRCECGEAMVPRTRDGYELYYCNGRSKLGKDFCGMKAVRRQVIDTAVYTYFEQVGLDVEATRQQIAEERDRKLAEVRALHHQAEQESRRAEERLVRVRRDYQDGRIEADDWADQRTELTDEHDAARAEANRLAGQAREVEAWGELQDAEAEALKRLSAIRSAIAGQIQDADGVSAVRAALARTFEHFVVHHGIPEQAHVELIGSNWIEPVLREQAIEGYSETLSPVLRREPLHKAENKYGIGLACR